jgi:CHAT domain-containing protein/tetratricopeptide (TPR) repeat protein
MHQVLLRPTHTPGPPLLNPGDRQSMLSRANALLEHADARYRDGAYGEAAAVAGEAVQLRAAALDPQDPALAQALNAQAYFLYLLNDVARARPLFERALAIWEADQGQDAPVVATALNNLAMLLDVEGRYAEARPLMYRVVAIREAALGVGHPDVTSALNNLALTEESLGNPIAARRLWERALRDAEEGSETAAALNNLAGLLSSQGDADEAQRLYERALSIRERLHGEDHPAVADVLVNVAKVLRDRGEGAAAVPILERVIRIWRNRKGDDHPDVAAALSSLAAVHNDLGRWSDARSLLEQSLAIWEYRFGRTHPEAVAAMNNLALVQLRAGDAVGAKALWSQALDVRKAALSADHPAVAPLLTNLATAELALGNAEVALDTTVRAGEILHRHVRTVMPALSSAEQAAFVRQHLAALASLLLATGEVGDQEAVVGLVLGRKGLLHEGLRRQAAMGRIADGSVGELAAKLQEMRRRMERAGRASNHTFAELERERERLERELAKAVETVSKPGHQVDLDDVWDEGAVAALSEALPDGHVFVDVVEHERVLRGVSEGRLYSAIWVGREGAGRIDLGDADAADAALRGWRRLRGLIATLEPLRTILWQPIEEAISESEIHVWVSPDGALARAPWSAFPLDAASRGRSRERRVSVVPSARALLRLLRPAGPIRRREMLVVGDIDYGADADRWPRLAWTGTEASQVAARAREVAYEVTVLRGREATTGAVAAFLQTVSVAHLATHGFLGLEEPGLVGSPGESFARGRWIAAEDVEVAARTSPLVESGLVLAGSNEGAAGELTAEEIVGLPLDGLQLLVLSACETGRGLEVGGQGVLGLQAAAHAAGVRTVLGTLWPVPDASSASLMAAFYHALWSDGQSPAEALATAQATVRAAPDFGAVVNWAGWSLSGNAFDSLRLVREQ